MATVLHRASYAIIADTKKCTYTFQLAGGWNFWRSSVSWLRSCGMSCSLIGTNVSQRSSAFVFRWGPFFFLFRPAFLPLFLIAAFRNFLRQLFNYFLPSVLFKCYFFISVAQAVSRCNILLTLVSIHRDLLCPQLLLSFVTTYTIGHAVALLVETLR